MISDGRLVILAGGISSRMKKSVSPQLSGETSLVHDADSKAKSMIGVGRNQRPFLDYLLYNAKQTGYEDVLIVIGEGDESIRRYYGDKDKDNAFSGLRVSYAIQRIPPDRQKPLGTADALYQGLNVKRDWSGKRFTVCNSDNLYSEKALGLMLEHRYSCAMIDYDRHALQFEWSRIERFAVTLKDAEGFLTGIIEKPSEDQITAATGKNGFVGVSMNIFDLQYDMILPFLEKVPFHPLRSEKELPEAVTMMVKAYPKCLFAYPLSEHVLDLTDKNDILPVKRYLETHFENATL
ncbi:MAG TPA: sugar phosphate nucleotidyltransferase [Bacteroidota bacterium]|nr:sugar phosphate nucleotidyltransferase [Bacteroidota bacterium]